MKRTVHFIALLLFAGIVKGQAITRKLEEQVRMLEHDSQVKNGIIGIYVINQKTGAKVFGRNEQMGLAAASSQKVITSTASLDLLGTEFRYTTTLSYDGRITNGILNGNIYIRGSGDPTLGSWRYNNTKEQLVLTNWLTAIKQSGIKEVQGRVIGDDTNWETQTIPGGWIWDDIGNYYGAGSSALNWRENQYDLNLAPGNKAGDEVRVVSIVPTLYNVTLTNELTTGRPGSGDNGYIYLPPYSSNGFVRGTVPPDQRLFTISGSFPDPPFQLAAIVTGELAKQGISVDSLLLPAGTSEVVLYKHQSPSLDSINYWFLKKSINLYGEALVKTLGFQQNRTGSTEYGLTVIKNFWEKNGVEPATINMIDGSGLSPQNRVTAAALVKVMQYARSRPWFASFSNALPDINGMKMKSGTIGGVKSFTGYAGNYTFAIIVNNFSGSSSQMVAKMYKVLDLLK